MSQRSVADRVLDVICEELGVSREQCTPSAFLQDDLNADSLDCVELVMALEKEFDIDIPDAEAETLRTVGALIAHIERVVG